MRIAAAKPRPRSSRHLCYPIECRTDRGLAKLKLWIQVLNSRVWHVHYHPQNH